MIEVRGLRKSFGSRTALDDVSLSVADRERVMLVGPNGAGKTTLLRILATLGRPSAGSVLIDGRDPFREWAKVRASIGFLSHQTLLYGDLSARQNLRFYARMYQVEDADARIDELLRRVDLHQRQDDLVRGYSRGMQQRLAVARAVLHGPTVLLLDEPYSGLDPIASESLTRLLDGLADDGCTLLLTSHRPVAEGRLVDRVVALNRGRVVHDGAFGDPRTFADRYRSWVGAAEAA